jgi:hypothetical protein
LLGATSLAAQQGIRVLDAPAAKTAPQVAATATAGVEPGCAVEPHDGTFESAVGFLPSRDAANVAQRFTLPAAGAGAEWFLDDVCLALTRDGPAGTSAFAFAVFADAGGLPGDVLAFRRVEAALPAFPGSTVCLGDFAVALAGHDAIHVGMSWNPKDQNVFLMTDTSAGTALQTVSVRGSASGPDGLAGWSPVTAGAPAVRSAGVGITLFASVPQWPSTPLPTLAAAPGAPRLLGGVATEARHGSLLVALLVFGDPATPPPAPQSWYAFVAPRDDPAAGRFTRLALPFPAAWFVGDELTPWHGDREHFAVPVVDDERNLLLLHLRLAGAGREPLRDGPVATGEEAGEPGPTTGRIEGQITDETGSPLADATVTVLHEELGLPRTTNATGNGRYHFADLRVGQYQVVVSAPGFAPETYFVGVGVGRTVSLDVELAPTGIDLEITVTAEPVEVAPEGAVESVIQADLAALPGVEGDSRHCLAYQTTSFGGRILCHGADRRWHFLTDLEPPVVTGPNGAFGFSWWVFEEMVGAPAAACVGYGRATSPTSFDRVATCTDGVHAGPETNLGSDGFQLYSRRASLFDLGVYSNGALGDAWLTSEPGPDAFGLYPNGEGGLEVFCQVFAPDELSLLPAGSDTLPADLPTDRAVDTHVATDRFGGRLDVTYRGAEGSLLVDRFRRDGDCEWRFSGRYDIPGSTPSSERYLFVEEHATESSLSPFRGYRSPGSYLLERLATDEGGTYPLAFVDSFVPRPCVPSDAAHCLTGGRFEVEASWRTRDGRTGAGRAAPLTDDTGLFTFFGPGNVELFAKTLDACDPFGRFWVFSAGLTDVEYGLGVFDSLSGRSRHYVNPLGRPAQPILDTRAFQTCGNAPQGELPAWARDALAHRRSPRAAAPSTGACSPGPAALCLAGGRFRVEAEWETATAAGQGQAIDLTDDTGAFWFFGAANVEVLVKVLDACTPPFDRFWVFAAGLTDVAVRLTVTDAESGERREYRNLPGRAFVPIQDTDAFATCP